MQFKTKGKLLQLKDDYIKNVTVKQSIETVRYSDTDKTQMYHSDVDIELGNSRVMKWFNNSNHVQVEEGTLIKFLMFNKDYFENMTTEEFKEFFNRASAHIDKSGTNLDFFEALNKIKEDQTMNFERSDILIKLSDGYIKDIIAKN